MKKNHNRRIILISILIILLFSAFFRFYKLNQWMTFGMDQEYEALIVRNIFTLHHFPLIGVNASDTGLYLGPFFIYFAAIPFALFKGNPVGWAITASLVGVLVTYLIFKVSQSLFSVRVGIFASLIYAVSFLVAFYDRQFWNPVLVPLFSLIIGYLTIKLLSKKTNCLPLLALVFGIAIQSHLSILIFLPVLVFAVIKNLKFITRKVLIISVILFLLTQLPIIAFDLRHNFTNTRALLHLITNNSFVNTGTSTFMERSSIFLSTLGRFVWIPYPVDIFLESGQCKDLTQLRKTITPEIIAAVIFAVAVFVWVQRKNRVIKNPQFFKNFSKFKTFLLVGIIFPTFLFILFYNRGVFEYYYLYLFPWLAIFTGLAVNWIWKKEDGNIFVTSLLIFFIVLNLLSLLTAENSYAYSDKIKAVNFVKEYIGSSNYSLEAMGECPRYGGYRYLFGHFLGEPVSSYMDSYFSWLYTTSGSKRENSKVVLLSMIDSRENLDKVAMWESEKMHFLSSYNLLARTQFSRIAVYIFDAKPIWPEDKIFQLPPQTFLEMKKNI
jgi:hypothetical protein